MDSYQIALVAITLAAAIVNGALGYGFSSITVPLALLFLTNRVLNPALVPIEVALNAYVLWVNRAALPGVWRRVLPIVIGLLPGVLLGTALVSRVSPGWLKFGTFIALLPLILFQAAGYRRPIRSERSVGLVFGGGVGLLYSVTTISGPPLAVMLSNQGLTKQDFRAALGFIRLAESSFTAVAYYYAGLYTIESMGLIPYILPSIAIGVPIGAVLIQRIRPETFRRICMSFDAWIVAFGLSTLLKDLQLVREQPRLPRPGCCGSARHLAALPLLLRPAADGQAGGAARRKRPVDDRHAVRKSNAYGGPASAGPDRRRPPMTPSDGASIASMTLLGLIQAIPADQTAVIAPEQNIRVTYGALRKQVQAVAEALAAAGVSRGDRVGIALPNGLPNIVSFLAASMAGTAAPLNPGYKEDEFRFYPRGHERKSPAAAA